MLGHEVAAHYQRLAGEAGALLERYGSLRASLKRDLDRVSDLLAQERVALAAIYLPRLDAVALVDAEKKTGFRGFSRRDPLEAKAKEKRRLEHDIEQIRGAERYQRRTYLVGKEGELTRELAEAREMLDPWERDAARFEDLEDFLVLVDVGYDTPEFSERWWEASRRVRAARGAVQRREWGGCFTPCEAYPMVVGSPLRAALWTAGRLTRGALGRP